MRLVVHDVAGDGSFHVAFDDGEKLLPPSDFSACKTQIPPNRLTPPLSVRIDRTERHNAVGKGMQRGNLGDARSAQTLKEVRRGHPGYIKYIERLPRRRFSGPCSGARLDVVF